MSRALLTLLIMLTACVGCEFKKFDHKRAEINHLRMIGLLATNYKVAYKHYPTAIDTDKFEAFLANETLDDTWGTVVKYERAGDGYVVTSAGPDKTHGTFDDLRLTSADVEDWDR